MSETSSTRTPAATRTSLIVRGYPDVLSDRHLDPFIDPCPSWCVDLGSGHRVQTDDVDRLHMGELINVEYRYGRGEFQPSDHNGPACVGLNWVSTYLMRRNGEREARIHVGEFEMAGLTLTPAEAVALSDVLRDLAEQAEQ